MEWMTFWTGLIALTTVVYVIGTFLLWWTTKKTLETTRDAFKLNFVMAMTYELRHQPADNVPSPVRQAIEMSNRDKTLDILKRVFPREYEELIAMKKERRE